MDSAVWRILDSNANRAREALRVLEEHARFVLDDEALTERIKRRRHELAAALEQLSPSDRLANRDVEHDVGTGISTDSEAVRSDGGAVVAAAAGRATEALRCLEEYGKVFDRGFAARIEQLRYAVYTIEQDIRLTGPRRAGLRAARLHVLITEALCAGPWLTVCEQAVAGGADVLQLREKRLPDAELLDRARRLRVLTTERHVLFVVNDRPDIARLCGADGVHVGQNDLSVSDARRIAGPTVLVGKSTHSVEQARAALAERPDYLAVGPMFASATEPERPVQGPELLAAVAAFAGCPVVAIGGIKTDRLGGLDIRDGVQIAVCKAIIGSSDARASARALADAVSAGAGRQTATTNARVASAAHRSGPASPE